MSGLIGRGARTARFGLRRAVYSLPLLMLACALATQGAAQPTATSGPPDSIMAMTGVFRAGRAHDIAIAPLRTPAGWMLLLADVQSDQLRLLAPAGKSVYTAGAEF